MAGIQRKFFRDDALVLRTYKLGEADHIVSLLGRRSGRMRAVAKGVRRTSSKFGARLSPFGHVDLQLIEGRNLHTVTQVVGIDLYGKRIAEDYQRYTAACAISETAERLTPEEHEPSLRIFQLTLGALRALADGEYPPPLVLDAYLLRAMSAAGWAPALTECAICGRDGQHRAFSVSAGGCVCRNCRPAGSTHPAPETFSLLKALVSGDWKSATASAQQVRNEASGLVSAHLQWHLERSVRSLSYVQRTELRSTEPSLTQRRSAVPNESLENR
ncbi:DNA replication and repair protein RecO [Stackebrandtia endophytica]|uniref:DNA repair protein RecO n=1 Tax=Stackebrandtia endophytica TaxID=1496996 RepID=A0A543ASJ3_9ACTN|nr:DNA repair protein RecO [Stackebrandtia endophytica]TQL75550.1 DNA replication and repair protein RecO [Stackebrandtia endophytica]